MKKKIQNINLTRQKNAFPFLSKSLDIRLKQSKSINLVNNYKILEKDGYWNIFALDKKQNK